MEANVLRRIQEGDLDISYEIVKKCLDKFFFDLILYCYDFDKREIITIDCNYLPYHLISTELLKVIIDYLEKTLGYAIMVQKVDNVRTPGHKKGDMIHINIYNRACKKSDLDRQFLFNEQRTIYSTFHKYSEIHGDIETSDRLSYLLDKTDIVKLNPTNIAI